MAYEGPSPPARCTWLAAEALQAESKAAELDNAGSWAEALLHHRRAAAKLTEAASLCPDEHPDKSALDGFALEVSTRVMYLDSLGGTPATIPLEDHVGEINLVMDTSVAPPPEEEAVPALIARAGVSGQSAPLLEEGYQLVAALSSQEEMYSYILRVMDANWLRLSGDAAPAELLALAQRLSSSGSAGSMVQLRDALRKAPWLELNLDPSQDRLQIGVALQAEAQELEAQGRREEALQTYEKSAAVIQLVYKFDARCKNANIKEMVRKRLEELLGHVERLKLEVASATLDELGSEALLDRIAGLKG